MDKKPLIGVCILAEVLLVLGSLSNVVGYQTVKSSQHQTIREAVNQRKLIIPTIEPTTFIKQQLKQMHHVRVILSKIISQPGIQTKVQHDQLMNPSVLRDITPILKEDSTLYRQLSQFSLLNPRLNLTLFQILYLIFLLIFYLLMVPVSFALLLLALLSGVSFFVAFTIFLPAFIIEKYTGVRILGDILTYAIALWALTSSTIFGLCYVILFAIWILPFYTPYAFKGGTQ